MTKLYLHKLQIGLLLRKLSITIFLFFGGLFLYGQDSKFRIKILDESTREPIEFATIIFLPNNGGTYSDHKGDASFDFSDSIMIRHLSYYPKTIIYSGKRDTVLLIRRDLELETITVYPKKGERIRARFPKNHPLKIAMQSFECGRVVDLREIPLTNLAIPFKLRHVDLSVKLKIYSTEQALPGKLLYAEVQNLHHDSDFQYIVINNDELEAFRNKDSVFVSVELLSIVANLKNQKEGLTLFLTDKMSKSVTFHTRNFDVTQEWFPFEIDNKQRNSFLNLVVVNR